MRYEPALGGVSATGCLWGVREDRKQVYWHFIYAWDPVAERAFLYQSGGDGRVGIGTHVRSAWQPRRTYTWIRGRAETAPC